MRKGEQSNPPSDEASRFKDAMRRILSLTPAQREEVKRKVDEEAGRKKPARKGKRNEQEG